MTAASTTGLTRGSTAEIVWRLDSDPFGTSAPNENPSGLGAFAFNLRFPGQRRYQYVCLCSWNPIGYVDSLGLHAIYVHYNGYPVNTGYGFHLPLGHAAVVAVNPSAAGTRYYEVGRYDKQQRGDVLRRWISDLTIGPDGRPTPESLKKLYDYISGRYGKDSSISAMYYPETDYQSVLDFAEQFYRNHPDYALYSNNCKTFARRAAT